MRWRTAHHTDSLNITQDLYDRFGLNAFAATLARVTPDGKKNTVRKTYKGYIKTLGIAGQFDADKKDENEPGTLTSLWRSAPTREIWQQNFGVLGKEIDKGITGDLRSVLGKAVIMVKGTIPKARFNSSVLGEMGNQVVQDPLKVVPAKAKAPISHGTMSVPKQNKGAADIPRPKRSSAKKRTYGDSSYEGYGEGYIDDDAEFSTGDGDDRAGGRKRPKKVGSVLYPSNVQANKAKTSSNNFKGPMRQSYGPGMVGAWTRWNKNNLILQTC